MNFKYTTYLFFLIAACFLPGVVRSQDIPKELYNAAGIPDSLKENANSVIRYSSDQVIIKGPGQAIVKHHRLVTILNEKGDHEAIIEFGYNRKYDSYSDIEIRAYNADGTLLKKYHKSDMYDGAVIDNETLVADERFFALKHTVASYPASIEVEYEETLSSFISLEDWHIQTIEQSVQNEIYSVTAKTEVGFRYKCRNFAITPVKTINDAGDTYTWQVHNLKAIKKEENVLNWTVLPVMLFGTSAFDCYGYPGDMSSWQNYGKWVFSLNKDVCTLSPERIVEIKKMTDTIKTDKAKAKFLYEYMQSDMRYVSIQLGIGGFKPFAATFVDQKKYGDCKALANYMYSLLSAVNIRAYWAIIRAGVNEYPADPHFPNNSFNHEILCIPFKNDTTWLECTSTTQPFGKLGSFTENRNALLITENGGELVNTPKSSADDNQFNSEVHLTLDSTGGAKAQIKILSSGGYRDDYIGIAYLKTDEQKEYLMHMLNIKQPSVFDYNPVSDVNGIKEVTLNLEYDQFCDIMAGNKQFYRPHVFDICAFTLPVQDKRSADYYYQFPLKKTCVTTIDLPPGYEIETLPANQNLKFSYGNFDITYIYNAAKNEVISTAKFNITKQVIPAAKYSEMQQYLDAVGKAQNKKLVIRRKA